MILNYPVVYKGVRSVFYGNECKNHHEPQSTVRLRIFMTTFKKHRGQLLQNALNKN